MTRKQKRQQRKRRVDGFMRANALTSTQRNRLYCRLYMFFMFGPYDPVTGKRPWRKVTLR